METRKKIPAVFLDRDGVINEEVHHLRKVSDLQLLPNAAQAIKLLNEMGYRVIVITNQAIVAKDMATESDVQDIHAALAELLSQQGAHIDAFYYCPHHAQGTVLEYTMDCLCRKPNIGMIQQANTDFPFEPTKSFLVGDKTGDILTGNRAGLKTILVETGYGGKDNEYVATPDYIAKDILDALNYID